MALKGDRLILETDPAWFMDEVATRGGVVSVKTAGSGVALDQGKNLCSYNTAQGDGSGLIPLGILLDDMVNIDLTQYKLNQHKSQVQQGGKVSIVKRGWVLTNVLTGTISVGRAYLAGSGYITSTPLNINDLTRSPAIGRIESTADEDGYAKVYVSLPNVPF